MPNSTAVERAVKPAQGESMDTLTMNIKREFFADIVAEQENRSDPVAVLEAPHRAVEGPLQVAPTERMLRHHPRGRDRGDQGREGPTGRGNTSFAWGACFGETLGSRRATSWSVTTGHRRSLGPGC